MINNFEEIQKVSKDNMDTAMKSFGAVSKTFQAIATEVTDYSKKSFEEGTAALEKLMGAKTLEKAIEVQTDFVKSAYEGFVSRGHQARRHVFRSRQGNLQADRRPGSQGQSRRVIRRLILHPGGPRP